MVIIKQQNTNFKCFSVQLYRLNNIKINQSNDFSCHEILVNMNGVLIINGENNKIRIINVKEKIKNKMK